MINGGGRAAELAAPPCSCSSLKDAMFSVLASLQTTKSVMTHALCSRTWHAISAEKHTANCIKAGCCVSFLVFFLFYSRLTDILRCFFQFLFPKASGLACPGEGCKTHEWQDEAETEKLHPGFACVIEWAGMGTKKHWL